MQLRKALRPDRITHSIGKLFVDKITIGIRQNVRRGRLKSIVNFNYLVASWLAKVFILITSCMHPLKSFKKSLTHSELKFSTLIL